MSGFLPGLLSGLLVIFVAWVAKTIFLSRRLFLIQPKLFDYSDLINAQDSKTLELTVFNGGTRSEEDVQIQLSPSFRYTIIASDAAGLSVDVQGVLRLDRLAPKQDRTVILTAEGGDFRKEHVVGIASKETVGKIKDKLQEAQLTPAQNALMTLVIFVIFPAFGYGVGKFIETEVWPNVSPEVSRSKQVDFKVENNSIDNVSASNATSKVYGETFSIQEVVRNGDIVTIKAGLKNQTKSRLQFTLISSSPVSEKRPLGVDYIVADILVFPGAEKVIEVSDYLPSGVSPALLSLKVIVEGPLGRSDFMQDVRMGMDQ